MEKKKKKKKKEKKERYKRKVGACWSIKMSFSSLFFNVSFSSLFPIFKTKTLTNNSNTKS
jgi:hypothetical protein